MYGAAIVLVLAGLVLPITLVLAALVWDALVLAWFLWVLWYGDVWPGLRKWSLSHGPRLHMPHVRLSHR